MSAEKGHPGISTYPQRIVTLHVEDCGPLESAGGRCPHCGAEGRWIHYFLCDDGNVHGAMSGCKKLYPEAARTKLSIMAEKAIEKDQEARRKPTSGGPVKLASWFKDTLDALEKLRAGTITLADAEAVAGEAYDKRENWLYRNGYRQSRRRR